MPEQDDLFEKAGDQSGQRRDENDFGEELPAVEETVIADPQSRDAAVSEPQASKKTGDISGGGIAGGEVRVVERPPATGSSNRLLLILLGIVVLLGGGIYLLNNGMLHGPAATDVTTQLVSAQPPVKMPIERPVEEVVLGAKAVAAAQRDPAAAKPLPEAPVENRPAEVNSSDPKTEPVVPIVAAAAQVQAPAPVKVLVGPFLSSRQLDAAVAEVQKLGFTAAQTKGRGLVTMIRLLEGVYPPDLAHQRLAELQKTVKSAFLLPAGGKLALYAGSFADPERANELSAQLGKKGVKVTQVASDIEMNGKLLSVAQADRDAAQKFAAQIAKAGLKTKVIGN